MSESYLYVPLPKTADHESNMPVDVLEVVNHVRLVMGGKARKIQILVR